MIVRNNGFAPPIGLQLKAQCHDLIVDRHPASFLLLSGPTLTTPNERAILKKTLLRDLLRTLSVAQSRSFLPAGGHSVPESQRLNDYETLAEQQRLLHPTTTFVPLTNDLAEI